MKRRWIVMGWMLAASYVLADSPSLDELLNLEPAPSQQAEDSQPSGEKVDLEASVRDRLEGRDAPGDAFKQAVLEMDRVSVRLGRAYDPGIETQRMQASILRKLDQVIAQAKQQQSSSSSGGSGSSSGSSNPSNQDNAQGAQASASASASSSAGAAGSSASTGSSGTSDAASAKPHDQLSIQELRDQWGSLPPRLRDELSQGLNEHFSSVYRVLTQRYYQRLAEEQE